MGKPTNKRQRPDHDDSVMKTNESKRVKKENDSKSSTSLKKEEIQMHEGTNYIDFNRNIYTFSNMREFMEQVFDDDRCTTKLIIESLVLLLLEVSCSFTNF